MRRKKLHVSLTLLAYLLSGGLGGSGTLCIGADGHVEIEPVNASCCSKGCADSDVSTNRPPTDQDCGTCLDIPLLNDHIQSRGVELRVSNHTDGFKSFVFSSLSNIASFMPSRSICGAIDFISPGEISSAHLQCTILLC